MRQPPDWIRRLRLGTRRHGCAANPCFVTVRQIDYAKLITSVHSVATRATVGQSAKILARFYLRVRKGRYEGGNDHLLIIRFIIVWLWLLILKLHQRVFKYLGNDLISKRRRRLRGRRSILAYATGSTGLAITVRGSSRRIMIMRFRPANIRLINRRSNCSSCCSLCLRETTKATTKTNPPIRRN